MTRPALLALTFLFAVPPSYSQTSSDGPPLVRTSAQRLIEAAGPGAAGSRVVLDPVNGNPTFVYGFRLPLATTPRSDGDFLAASRALVAQFPEFFGFAPDQLVPDAVKRLPLSRIGSSDKIAVTFRQQVDGIAVLESSMTFLFDARSGDLLAIDQQTVPGAGAVDLLPRSSASEAIVAARAEFVRRFGVGATEVVAIEPVIVGPSARFDAESTVPDRGPTLAYRVELANPLFLADGAPADAEFIVSAEGDLTVFRFERQSHTAIGGTVRGNVNLGPEPNTGSNQEQPALEFLHVKDAATNQVVATTNAAGVYTIPSDAPFNAYLELNGPYCVVTNKQGANARIDIPMAGPGNFDALFNPTKSEFTTAEVAAFYWTNEFRDWLVSVDPSETTFDFPVKANVNLADTCNAFFSGNSINFFAAGGGCTNTSYRAVCHHEEGHFANEKFNGAVSGAFHEGVADAWAYYISDDPCLTSFGGGGCLRNGEQTSVKKCPNDGDESCHGGQVHEEGKAIASALWSVRKNMKTQFGAGPGGAAASALFVAWFQAFNDRKILNVIQDHWVALDDDNGSLVDLTPHLNAITSGFQAYSWPGYVIPDLDIEIVSAPSSNGSVNPGAPVTITADLTSLMGSVVARELRYSTDNGANWTTLTMAPSGPANRYAATIPAQTQGKRVRWYIRTTSSFGGNVKTYPANGGPNANVYAVGFFFEMASWSFDGFTDEGFTHVNLSGTNGDQWQRANPAYPGSNESTDPDFAYSGKMIWGTDLSIDGSSDGKYEPNSSGELRTPILNLSGSASVILQFRRQLAVQSFNSDQATVRVNGVTVWQNPSGSTTNDGGWTLQEIDITSLAANNPSVQISWRLLANGSTELGGWNIDDVVIYRVDPPYPGYFQTYGEGCIGSWGYAPTLVGKGPPSPGQTVTLQFTGALPFNQVFLFGATGQGNAPISHDCRFYLSGLLFLPGLPILCGLDGTQSLSFPIPIGSVAGDAYLQFFANDPGGLNDQYTVSNGLRVHVE